MKLNLGCGKKKIEGFVNIDIDPAVMPDITFDVSLLTIPGLIIDDPKTGEEKPNMGCADEIVAYDVIEHFDRFKYKDVLKSWYDLLEPGGLLMVRTNDIDRLIGLYMANKTSGMGPMTDDLFVWHMMCEHEKGPMGHRWSFSQRMMREALREAGFGTILFTSNAALSAGNYPYADCSDLTNMHVKAFKDEANTI